MFVNFAFAQQEPELIIEENFDINELTKKFETLDSNKIPTGILHDKVISFVDFDLYSGSDRSEVVDYYVWRQILDELKNSAVKKQNFPSLKIIANQYKDLNVLPVLFLNYNYNTIKTDAFDKNLIIEKDNFFYNNTNTTETPYDDKRIFVASIPYFKIDVKNNKFILSDDLFFSNINKKPEYYLIDFDDGDGYNKYETNSEINVSYQFPGEKFIKIKAVFNDDTLSANFSTITTECDAPPPDVQEFPITASIPYWNYTDTHTENDINGAYGKAKVSVWYAPGHNQLIKPFILLDGFDPFVNIDFNEQARDFEKLYCDLNQVHTLDMLQQCYGYDIVVVDWVGGADWIQKNGLCLVEVLNWVNENKVGFYPNIIIGPSMGGMIGRFGLSYMEDHNMRHDVSVFIPADSPHRGANIPLGMQFWVNYLYAHLNKKDDASDNIKIFYEMLMSPAARQLLLYHFNASVEEKKSQSNPKDKVTCDNEQMRDDFVSDLNSLGNNGYPSQPTLIGISNGSGFGHNQNNENNYNLYPNGQIMQFEVEEENAVFKAYALPGKDNTYHEILKVNVNGIRVYTVRVKNTDPLDCVPGGFFPGLEPLNDISGMTLYHAYVDFIPTISALDLDHSITNYYTTSITSQQTPFDYIYFPLENPIAVAIDVDYNPTYPYNYNQQHSAISDHERDYLLNIVHGNLPQNGTVQNRTISGEVVLQAYNSILAGANVNPYEEPGDVVIQNGSNVKFIAGNSIHLQTGFHAGQGFQAHIEEVQEISCDLTSENAPFIKNLTYELPEHQTDSLINFKIDESYFAADYYSWFIISADNSFHKIETTQAQLSFPAKTQGRYSVYVKAFNHNGESNVLFDYVYIQNTNSPFKADIKQNNVLCNSCNEIQSSEMIIFPNPVENIIYLSYFLSVPSDVKFTIVNSLGKVEKMAELPCQYEGKHEFMLNIEDLSSGLYFIILETSDGIISKKIIKI
ncbi:MAG: T9SS type A sorting domain-containing protein [Bacteroidales bacterium]|nr:T9SS type A sorting domain-containing protein [Bacteroidales bacterium]